MLKKCSLLLRITILYAAIQLYYYAYYMLDAKLKRNNYSFLLT